MSGKTLETRAVTYTLEIAIEASRARVWDALTDGVDAWWLPDFHMVGEGSVLSLDARAGGQLLEARPDGGSLLWYTVAMCTPGESLHLVGHVAPAFGGPATTMLHLALEERGDHTLLRVQDALVGHVDDGNVECLAEGWKQLFTDGLKRHAEAG